MRTSADSPPETTDTYSEFDPAQAQSIDDLARCLRQLHLRADRPSFRLLEDRTKHAKGLLPGTRIERVPLRRSTLSDVLQGQTFPRKGFLLTLVEACGVDLAADQRWEQAWDRLAVEAHNHYRENVLCRRAPAAARRAPQQLATADARAGATQAQADKTTQLRCMRTKQCRYRVGGGSVSNRRRRGPPKLTAAEIEQAAAGRQAKHHKDEKNAQADRARRTCFLIGPVRETVHSDAMEKTKKHRPWPASSSDGGLGS